MIRLQIGQDISPTAQFVTDGKGHSSQLSLSTAATGIGTASPSSNLDIVGVAPTDANTGQLRIAEENGHVMLLGRAAAYAFVQSHNHEPLILNPLGNRVGVGTTNPAELLHVNGGQIMIWNPGSGSTILTLGTERPWAFKQTGSGGSTALELAVADPNNNDKNFIINTGGSVGIGTLTPQAKLDVNGSIAVSDDIVLAGADCAEEFEIRDDSETEPGTVMIIMARQQLRHSCQAYDQRVAGIVAGAGNARPGIVLGRSGNSGRRLPIALSGTAYCRVDASIHPVNVGDMLTTSYRPGFAMRAIDRDRSFGAVIGKALSGLTGGVGLVPVLVSLQ
jgi:hypothetical protein